MKYELVQLEEPEKAQEQPSDFEHLKGAIKDVGRVVGGTAANFAAGVAKLPSNIYDLGVQLATPPFYSPEEKKRFREMYSTAPDVEKIGERVQEYLPEGLMEPQNEIEKFIYNTAQAVPGFISPGLAGGKINIAKNAIATALGSEAGKKFAEHLGFKEFGQFAGSLAGAGLATGLLNARNLENLATQEYSTFSNSIPTAATLPAAQNTKNALKKVADLDLVPEQLDLIKPALDRLRGWMGRKKAGIAEAWKDKKFINKMRRETSGLNKEGKRALDILSGGITDDIVSAGSKYKGLATQSLKDADNLTWGLRNMSPVRQFLNKYVTIPKIAGAAAGETLLNPVLSKAVAPGLTKGAIAAGLAGKSAINLVEPALKSRVAAKELLAKTAPNIYKGAKISQNKPSKEYELVSL